VPKVAGTPKPWFPPVQELASGPIYAVGNLVATLAAEGHNMVP